MKLAELTAYLESIAPLSYQEDYDNSGLIVGNGDEEITGALISLDCTEAVIDEAIRAGYNLVISHHPIVFKGLKKFNARSYVSRAVVKAIRHNICLYAIHTNLDHVEGGVNSMICRRLGLEQTRILAPKSGILKKLVTYVPAESAGALREALFKAGAGHIGRYSECSFALSGKGTFKGESGTSPYVGQPGIREEAEEERIELIYPAHEERRILMALFENHPYEEVAYDLYNLSNSYQQVGAGMIGNLPSAMEPARFLEHLKRQMACHVVRHTTAATEKIHKVAVCGGSGSFLLKEAIAAGADVFVSADFKYHEFFDADGKTMIADIGHFETEQFTSDLLLEIITGKFRNFAVRKTEHNTNPINYFI